MHNFCLGRKGRFCLFMAVSLGLSAGLMACGDDSGSSAVNSAEEQPGSSNAEDGNEQSSSSVACTAELEGETQLVWEGNDKYGTGRYEKCINGEWSKVATAEVKCPKDASVGDTCYVNEPRGFFYRNPADIYVFAEEGTWRYQDPNACTPAREGVVLPYDYYAKYHYSYKICHEEKWEEISFDELVKREEDKLPKDAAEGDSAGISILERAYVFSNGEWKRVSYISGIDDVCTEELDKEIRYASGENADYICRGEYGEWFRFDVPLNSVKCTKDFIWNANNAEEFFLVEHAYAGPDGESIVADWPKDCLNCSFSEAGALKFTVSAKDIVGGVYAVSFFPSEPMGGIERGDVTEWGGLCFDYTSSVPLMIVLNPNADYDNESFGNHFDDSPLEMYYAKIPAASEKSVAEVKWENFKPYNGARVDLGLESTLTKVFVVQVAVEGVEREPAEIAISQIGSLGQCK